MRTSHLLQLFLAIISMSIVSCNSNTTTDAGALAKLGELNVVAWTEDGARTIVVSDIGWEGRTSPWSGTPTDLELLAKIGPINTLEITLYEQALPSAEFLGFLPKVKGLRELRLEVGPHFSDDQTLMKALGQCPDLQRLRIIGCSFSDLLKSGRGFAKLQEVDIKLPHAGKIDLIGVPLIHNLTKIYLRGRCLSADDVMHLAKTLPNLKHIEFHSDIETFDRVERRVHREFPGISVARLEGNCDDLP